MAGIQRDHCFRTWRLSELFLLTVGSRLMQLVARFPQAFWIRQRALGAVAGVTRSWYAGHWRTQTCFVCHYLRKSNTMPVFPAVWITQSYIPGMEGWASLLIPVCPSCMAYRVTRADMRHLGAVLFAQSSVAGQRVFRFLSLLVPHRHREEILGDFYESIANAKEQGYRRYAVSMLVVLKVLIYAWAVLKLRISDFVSIRSVNK